MSQIVTFRARGDVPDMKRLIILLFCTVFIVSLTACTPEENPGPAGPSDDSAPVDEVPTGEQTDEPGGGPVEETPTTNLSGTVTEILASIEEKAKEILGEEAHYPMSFTDPVTAEEAQGMLGMTEGEFNQYIEEAVSSVALIATHAHQVSLVKTTPGNAAVVKDLIAAGYNSQKWICVFPDKSIVITSGDYVLLAVGREENADAVIEAFKALAGTTSEANKFFEGVGMEPPEGGEGGFGMGGGLLPIE